jgi:hypothetical protein
MNLETVIRDAYFKALGMELSPVNMERAVLFVNALFDTLPPAGYTDGDILVEEPWMLEKDTFPVWSKP